MTMSMCRAVQRRRIARSSGLAAIWLAAGGSEASVFINEIDYDNHGTDTHEWIELAGPAGTSLDDLDLVFINQAGQTYRFIRLAHAGFVFEDDTGSGWGFFVLGKVPPDLGTADYTPEGWPNNEIQNGPEDSVQLRIRWDAGNVHLLDYEGLNPSTDEDEFTLLEDSNHEENQSLYKTGAGSGFADFTFANLPGFSSPGRINAGQALERATTVWGDQRPPRDLPLLRIDPNPFRVQTRISFQLDGESEATLLLYDRAGRLVCRLLDGVWSQGSHDTAWDGLDDLGHRVPAGVYFATLRLGGQIAGTRKVHLVR